MQRKNPVRDWFAVSAVAAAVVVCVILCAGLLASTHQWVLFGLAVASAGAALWLVPRAWLRQRQRKRAD